jgi:hypothetical protein
MIHELKCWMSSFAALKSGKKRVEVWEIALCCVNMMRTSRGTRASALSFECHT